MTNAEVIRDLLRQESQQKVFVSGKIFVDGKEEHVLLEVKNITSAQNENFNEGKKFTRLIF